MGRSLKSPNYTETGMSCRWGAEIGTPNVKRGITNDKTEEPRLALEPNRVQFDRAGLRLLLSLPKQIA
jgi:hypothetical protein